MNEHDLDVLNKGRQLRLSLPELLPILDKKINASMLNMFAKLDANEDITRSASKMAAYHELKQEILRTVKTVERLEGKLHDNRE